MPDRPGSKENLLVIYSKINPSKPSSKFADTPRCPSTGERCVVMSHLEKERDHMLALLDCPLVHLKCICWPQLSFLSDDFYDISEQEERKVRLRAFLVETLGKAFARREVVCDRWAKCDAFVKSPRSPNWLKRPHCGTRIYESTDGQFGLDPDFLRVLTPFYGQFDDNPRGRRRLPLQIKVGHISGVKNPQNFRWNRGRGRITAANHPHF